MFWFLPVLAPMLDLEEKKEEEGMDSMSSSNTLPSSRAIVREGDNTSVIIQDLSP